ncbi:four helix bundle protein [bacterium]|nr:four helix bundle protein [bacterium]
MASEQEQGYCRAHKRLDVWKESIDLAAYVYQVTSGFPKHETYGLQSQMRRAVVSISANIAEGAARNSKREFHQFLGIANGSISELDTLIEIALQLGYIADEIKQRLDPMLASIGRKLSGLIAKTRRSLEP